MVMPAMDGCPDLGVVDCEVMMVICELNCRHGLDITVMASVQLS
jgi:hypothetical protein